MLASSVTRSGGVSSGRSDRRRSSRRSAFLVPFWNEKRIALSSSSSRFPGFGARGRPGLLVGLDEIRRELDKTLASYAASSSSSGTATSFGGGGGAAAATTDCC